MTSEQRWAVAYINFYDNELSIEIVDADGWQQAASLHPKIGEFASECSILMENAKQEAFDQDFMFDVVAIPNTLEVEDGN